MVEKPRKEKKAATTIAPVGEPMIIVNVNDRLGTKAAIPCLASDPISRRHSCFQSRGPTKRTLNNSKQNYLKRRLLPVLVENRMRSCLRGKGSGLSRTSLHWRIMESVTECSLICKFENSWVRERRLLTLA